MPPLPYRFREGLFFAEVDGEGIVLDAVGDRYVALYAEAALIWRGVQAEETTEAIARRLTERFGLGASEGEELVRDQLESWKADGFLGPSTERVRARVFPAKAPGSPARAEISQEVVRATSYSAGAFASLLRALAWVRRNKDASLVSTLSDARLLGSFEPEMRPRMLQTLKGYGLLQRAVGAQDDCLPRALLLARALRYQGVPCDICFGVRKMPFNAHAWVELDGSALNESAAALANLAVVLRV